jgi:RNA polymerase sigma-70 factor (ECF subfamily)
MKLEVLHQIWNDHAQAIYAYLLRLSRDREQSADGVQDVFFRLAQNDALLERIAPDPRGFLVRLAHNLFVDKIRRAQACERVFAKMGLDGKEPLIDAADPDLAALDAATTGALERLPTDQRAVVYARLWKHLTFDEIALELGISINTAASRFRYGINKMREDLRVLYESLQPDGPGARPTQHPMKKQFLNPRGVPPEEVDQSGAFEEQLIQPLDARRVPSASAGGFFEALLVPEEDSGVGENVAAVDGSVEVASEVESGDGVESGDDGAWVDLGDAPVEDELPGLSFDQVVARIAGAEGCQHPTGPHAVLERFCVLFDSENGAVRAAGTLGLSGSTAESSVSGASSGAFVELRLESSNSHAEGESSAGNEGSESGVEMKMEINGSKGSADPLSGLDSEEGGGALNGNSDAWRVFVAQVGVGNPAPGFGVESTADLQVLADSEADSSRVILVPVTEALSRLDPGLAADAFFGELAQAGMGKVLSASEIQSAESAFPTTLAEVVESHHPDPYQAPGAPLAAWVSLAESGVSQPQPEDHLVHGGSSDDWSPLANTPPSELPEASALTASASEPGTDFLPLSEESGKPGWSNLDTVGVASILAGVARPPRGRGNSPRD